MITNQSETMLLQLLVLAVFVYSSNGLEGVEEKCPSTDISPCDCKTYFDGACIITCALATQKDVDALADIPNLCDGHVHFVLVHSNVTGISAKLWKILLSSKTVDVTIKHARVQSLVSDNESIGKVYTSGEAIIKVDHSKVDSWDWIRFKDFYSEEELTIVIDDTPLSELNEDFSSIASGQVHKVTIDSAGLRAIEDNQFVPFSDLASLSLQNNELISVSRSMLAKPAKALKFLHLNGNSLTVIPGDLFSEMPALEIVYLRDNRLKSLPQDLFKGVVSPNLKRVDFVNNPWECDCSLLRTLQSTETFLSMGVCASPEKLAQTKIKDLANKLDC